MSRLVSIVITFLFLWNVDAFSQEQKKHDISVFLSARASGTEHSYSKMLERYYNTENLYFEDECFDIIGDSYLGIGLEYSYKINNRFAIGLVFGFDHAKGGGIAHYATNDMENSYSQGMTEEGMQEDFTTEYFNMYVKSQHLYVFPSVKYYWTKHPKLNVYSKAGIGMSRHKIIDCDDSKRIKGQLFYQLSLFALELRSKNLGFYYELGYGHQGVFICGWKYYL